MLAAVEQRLDIASLLGMCSAVILDSSVTSRLILTCALRCRTGKLQFPSKLVPKSKIVVPTAAKLEIL